jgi:hypothetical protein
MSKSKAKNNIKKSINKTTLDIKHREKVNSFKNDLNKVPSKHQLLDKYHHELTILNKKDPTTYKNDDIHRKAYLRDQIIKIESEIDTVISGKNELDYYIKTIDILTEYYSDNDGGDDDFNTESDNENNILNYLQPKNQEIKDKNAKKKLSKVKLHERYLELVENNYSGRKIFTNVERCLDCNCDRVVNQVDGSLVCDKCGSVETIVTETDKPNYKEPIPDNTTYAYKRKNHLNEILSQVQAQESTEIPSHVYDKIISEINKRRIRKEDIDIERMRRILKRLNLRKYYEHVPHILYKINNFPPPTFTRDTIETFRRMFEAIQEPFAIYRPLKRKNFLNYFYVLHKFCQLLKLYEYLKYFPLLKNPKKLKEQEIIWGKICKFLGWKMIHSI